MKPSLQLLKISSSWTPEEEALALEHFLERLTGWVPPPEELEKEELEEEPQAAKAAEPTARPS